MSKGIIIVGFAGVGKTYLANKYDNILDFDYLYFKYNYPKQVIDEYSMEILKGNEEKRCANILWPQNYFTELDKNLEKYDIVLVPAENEILDYFENNNYDYILCYPNVKYKNIYFERYKNRGNNKNWIYWMNKNFEEYIKILNEKNVPKIILKNNENLEEKLIELKYIK